jgi:hypothetical protein
MMTLDDLKSMNLSLTDLELILATLQRGEWHPKCGFRVRPEDKWRKMIGPMSEKIRKIFHIFG